MTASGRLLPVKTHPVGWSDPMQMTGQWQCKRVVKWNAILQIHHILGFDYLEAHDSTVKPHRFPDAVCKSELGIKQLVAGLNLYKLH